jgi:Glycosyl transferase family 2
MSARRLASVITPTWQRSELLRGAIENVRAQTYRPLEHVVISDGVDRETARVAVAAMDCSLLSDPDRDVMVRYVPLGRNWSSFLSDSFCAAPLTVGMLVASGSYQTWLADDERMTPDHISSLVDALEAADADLAYSKVRMSRVGQSPEHGYLIGTDPPELGQITNVLYRAELLKRGLYPFGAGMTSDWACIERWLAAGARCAFVPRVTLTHRVDH